MSKHPRKTARGLASADALVFSLLGTAGAVEARLDAALRPVGLSLAKLGVLHHLAEAKHPLPLSELAKHGHCVRSNITQMVDRLEQDGFVQRRADPGDRRSVLAALTPAGKHAYVQGSRAFADAQRAIVRALSTGDAAHLRRALAALSG